MTGNQEYEAGSAGTTTLDPWLGRVVGDRYRIEERIGQGGMGVVYRGQHLELGKRVAIKRLDPRIANDPVSFERFRREAIAASRIESPQVVHVFDWGKADDGSPYLVMELLEGSDLRGMFQREGRLLAEPAAAVIGQVLRALMHTHQSDIIHRDLKPENVFLCRYDSDEIYVKLLDFGISKRASDDSLHANVTRAGVILGTASYMSPEQARGDAALDTRSDIYSVGAILYEALTGRVPHRGRTYEATLIDICTRDADDVRLHAPLVPEPLARVVARALQRDLGLRFQSAKEFLDALTAAVPDVGLRISDISSERLTTPRVGTTGSESSSSLGSRKARSPKAKLVWFISLLVAVGATAWIVLGQRRIPVSSAPATSTPEPHTATASVPASLPAAAELPMQADSAATAVSAAALYTALGGSSGRTTQHRQGVTTSAPTSGPNDAPGVASGLKLRRTMP